MANINSQLERLAKQYGGTFKKSDDPVKLATELKSNVIREIMASDIPPNLKSAMANSITMSVAGNTGTVSINGPTLPSIFGNTTAFMPLVYNEPNTYHKRPVFYYGEYKGKPNQVVRLDAVAGKGSGFVEKAATKFKARHPDVNLKINK